MNKLIIYGSQYGTTRTYAERLSQMTGVSFTDYKLAKDISKYDINTFKDKKQPKFIINDDYCAQNGISKKKALSLARKMLNYERIGEVYDPSLSLNENIKQMSELGVKVSKPTLISFKKFYNLN